MVAGGGGGGGCEGEGGGHGEGGGNINGCSATEGEREPVAATASTKSVMVAGEVLVLGTETKAVASGANVAATVATVAGEVRWIWSRRLRKGCRKAAGGCCGRYGGLRRVVVAGPNGA